MKLRLFKRLPLATGGAKISLINVVDSNDISNIELSKDFTTEADKEAYKKFGLFGMTKVSYKNKEDDYCIMTRDARNLLQGNS